MFANVSVYFRCACAALCTLFVNVVIGSSRYNVWNVSSEYSVSNGVADFIRPPTATSSMSPSSATTGRASPRYCRSTGDCGGLTCYWLYDGCRTGRCMCDPRKHKQDTRGRCTPLKEENEQCSEEEGHACQAGMECHRGRCRCSEGSRLTADGQYCQRVAYEKLLGESCSPETDICFHKSTTGYTRYDVNCNPTNLRCSCADGYKTDGVACRKWNIDEFGCRRSIQCEGGALCAQGRCSCPATHVAIAGNSKCAQIGAIIDLPSGEECDEINELRYCAKSLVCLRCPDDNVFKCVRFLLKSDYAYLLSRTDRVPFRNRSYILFATVTGVFLLRSLSCLSINSR